MWDDIVTQEHANGDETGQQNAAPDQNASREADTPDEHPADTSPPQSRASIPLSRRETLASLAGVSGLSLLSEPASAVPGSLQSPTGTARALDPQFSQTATFRNPDSGDIGSAVALSADGTTALIGDPWDDTDNDDSVGEAYVFARTAEGWNTDTAVTLPNPEPDEGDFFSDAVALSADGATALIGASGEEFLTGEAYVFRRTADGWNTDNPVTLPNPEPAPSDDFGQAVALSADGSTALIGAPGNVTDTDAGHWTGEVYVFTRTAEGWNTDDPVTLANPDVFEWFGERVALSADGTTALVDMPDPVISDGEVYLFKRTEAGWNTDNPILLPNPNPDSSRFGNSIALNADGMTALIGHQRVGEGGLAYLFEQETQSLISADHASSSGALAEQRGGIRERIRRQRR